MRLSRLRVSPSLLAIFAAFGTAGILIAPGVSANSSATDPTPTQIVWTSVSPSVLSYPGGEVTVKGVLETTTSPPQMIAGASVSVSSLDGATGDSADLFTNSAGQFTWMTNELVPLPITAQFSGDQQYARISSTAKVEAAQLFPTKIVLDPIKPKPIFSPVKVTGTLLMQLPDDSWVPSPYALMQSNQPGLPRTFTDQNGKFAMGAEVDPGHPLIIETSAGLGGTFWWSGDATTGPVVVPMYPDPTSVCGAIGSDFTPSPVGDIGFHIHSCYVDATGAGHDYAGAAQLFFQPAAGGRWTLMTKTQTGDDGMSHVDVSGYLAGGALAAGNWKWVIPAATGFAKSSTGPFAVVITVPTKISGLKFTRSGAKERLTGRLSYRTAGVAAAPVVIEHFSGGHWRNVATVHASSSGGFGYTFSRRLTGRYRVLYRGAALPGAEASFGSFKSTLSGAVRFT